MDKGSNKRLFSVREIADIFGINPQAVRYYHKEKLFLPTIRGANGYRKYDYNQIYELAKICYLRRVNFSIQDIQTYVKSTDMYENIALLREQAETITKQCNELLRTVDILARKVSTLQTVLRTMELDKPAFVQLEEKRCLPLGTEIAVHDLDLLFLFPTLAHYRLSACPAQHEISLSAHADREIVQMDTSTFAHFTVPGGLHLRCYHKGAYGTIPAKIDALRRAFSQYEFAEEVTTTNIVDQFVENDMNQYIVCIEMRVTG